VRLRRDDAKQLRRFAHHWGDRIQPTSGPSKGPRDIGAGGSFHLCRNGGVEHSGGLDQGIPIDRLRPTEETQDGWFWFFHHDSARAHNGVNFKIPCRVYKVIPESEAAAEWARKQGEALAAGAGHRDHDRVGELAKLEPITERVWMPDEVRAIVEYNKTVDPRDPRRLLPGMHPKFEYHNCARCKDGERACVRGDPGRCEWPHARND